MVLNGSWKMVQGEILCFHKAKIMAFPTILASRGKLLHTWSLAQTDTPPLVHDVETWPSIRTQSLPRVFVGVTGSSR